MKKKLLTTAVLAVTALAFVPTPRVTAQVADLDFKCVSFTCPTGERGGVCGSTDAELVERALEYCTNPL